MRVVAGELRGRTYDAPEGGTTRPTTDKVREAVFNALVSMGVLDEAVVADLYAGCGSLGFEALSRGASGCTFVERDSQALRFLRANIEKLGVGDRARIVPTDVMSVAAALTGVDVVFADPPYSFDAWEQLIGLLDVGLVVAESDREVPAPGGWEIVRSKRYGRTWVTFLERLP